MKKQKKVPQFHMAEFRRLLERVAGETDSFYHCSPETVSLIGRILSTRYRGRTDDIEYLMDMVNYQMRLTSYLGPKTRYPVSRHLDRLCKDPLYINKN